MDLQGIISISGRPGLFKIVTQGKSNVISVVQFITERRIIEERRSCSRGRREASKSGKGT